MTSPIDPIRRPGPARRTRRASDNGTEDVAETSGSGLPVPVGPARTHAAPEPTVGGAIEAQLLGQTGARRGLRAGPTVIGMAQASYNQAEWSGKKDRRAPKGRTAKTDV